VFSGNEPFRSLIEEVFGFLDVSNIRILKKTKWALMRIRPNINQLRDELQQEIVKHLLVFSWSYYNTDTALPLTVVAHKMRSDSWIAEMIKPDDNPSPEDKAWTSLASNLGLTSAEYDTYLLSLLTEGYVDETNFNNILAQKNIEAHSHAVAEKLHTAWDIYRDSFEDNLRELLDAFISIIQQDIKFIKLYDFSAIIDVLSQNGIAVDGFISNYLQEHTTSLSSFDLEDDSFGSEIKNEKLRAGINELTKTKLEENLNIDTVTEKIYKSRGWNRVDISYLSSLTVDELYDWMMSNPEDLKKKLKGGLLFFKNLQGANEDDNRLYKSIAKNTEEALLRVASTTPLNKKRVSTMYGVNISTTAASDVSSAS